MNKLFLSIMVSGLFSMFLNFQTVVYAEPVKVRVGHFSTVTHAQALIGRANGAFQRGLGDGATIDWKIFNAGPLAIEALFAGEIDILYVGPNPAVNGYVRSHGKALRIVAGVSSGGSALVVRADSSIKQFGDLKGKRVATPQIGNSQDIALRYLMKQKGLRSRSQGGDVEIYNIGGGDQISVLSKGDVDAVWTVEPWVSRLLSEANGRILIDEKELWPEGQYATAVLVVRKGFLDQHPDLVARFVATHKEITERIRKEPEEAKRLLNEELKRETGKSVPPKYLDSCFERITFTDEPMESSVLESGRHAVEVGFLRGSINWKDLYDLSFLEGHKAEDVKK